MTDDDRRRAQQRLADSRELVRQELAAAASPPRAATDRVAPWFAVGDRVLNLRGGQEGEVEDVRPADRDGVAWIWVRFDDGSRSALRAADLIARPKPPGARR